MSSNVKNPTEAEQERNQTRHRPEHSTSREKIQKPATEPRPPKLEAARLNPRRPVLVCEALKELGHEL
jgi:hypothetical protein